MSSVSAFHNGRPPETLPDTSTTLAARPEPLVLGLLAEGMSVELTVTGSSMSPFIRSQDTVTLEPIGAHRVRHGEVVAVARTGQRLVVHRIIAMAGSRIQTRGDSASQVDEWIERSRVVARVSKITRRGRAVSIGLGGGSALLAWLSRTGLLGSLLHPLRWLTSGFR